jgi:hypothetical protein
LKWSFNLQFKPLPGKKLIYWSARNNLFLLIINIYVK